MRCDFSDLEKVIRNLLSENVSKPTIFSYIQSLSEIVNRLSPKTLREKRDVEIAKEHLREVRRMSRKLQERVNVLEEQVKVLEETKEKKIEEAKNNKREKTFIHKGTKYIARFEYESGRYVVYGLDKSKRKWFYIDQAMTLEDAIKKITG